MHVLSDVTMACLMRAMHKIFLICLSSERSETSEFFGQRFQTLSEDLRFADVGGSRSQLR